MYIYTYLSDHFPLWSVGRPLRNRVAPT